MPPPKLRPAKETNDAKMSPKEYPSYNALVSSFIAKDAKEKSKQKDQKVHTMLPPKPGPRMTPHIRDSGLYALTPPQLHNQIESMKNGKRFPSGPNKNFTPI